MSANVCIECGHDPDEGFKTPSQRRAARAAAIERARWREEYAKRAPNSTIITSTFFETQSKALQAIYVHNLKNIVGSAGA